MCRHGFKKMLRWPNLWILILRPFEHLWAPWRRRHALELQECWNRWSVPRCHKLIRPSVHSAHVQLPCDDGNGAFYALRNATKQIETPSPSNTVTILYYSILFYNWIGCKSAHSFTSLKQVPSPPGHIRCRTTSFAVRIPACMQSELNFKTKQSTATDSSNQP